MLETLHKRKFIKDLKLARKRGKDLNKIKRIMNMLANQDELPARYRDHSLKGDYSDCRECHIEPDWLLIYLVQGKSITFVRTGSHADLFK